MPLFIAAILLASAPVADKMAYGIDFIVPVPPGYRVVRDRDSNPPGDVVEIERASPRETWLVQRTDPPRDGFTDASCKAMMDVELDDQRKGGLPVTFSQSIATPPSQCRYRYGSERREIRVFVVMDAHKRYVTACEAPKESVQESCELLTRGFAAIAAEAVHVRGMVVPVPKGFVIGPAGPEHVMLETNAMDRRFLITVDPPGTRQAESKSAEGTRLDARHRTIDAVEITLLCTYREADKGGANACDEVFNGIHAAAAR